MSQSSNPPTLVTWDMTMSLLHPQSPHLKPMEHVCGVEREVCMMDVLPQTLQDAEHTVGSKPR